MRYPGSKISRADELPLEWEQYDLLGAGFPATLIGAYVKMRIDNLSMILKFELK